jgi:LPS-assembly lipoprotein
MRVPLFHPTLLLLGLLGLLQACGFQLRGSADSNLPGVDPAWRELYLASAQPSAELATEVRARFASHGINWVERDAANYVIRLGPEQFEQRYLSLSAQARAAEYQLTMKAEFAVTDREGNELIPMTETSVIQQMENDPRNVVGKAEETRILRNEMRTELVQQILRRITYFAAGQGARASAADAAG